MEYIKALLLGIVQGFTEFLPVSSSGHLVLVQHFLKTVNIFDMSFDVFVHLGSLIAVIIFFRKEIFVLLQSLVYLKRPEYKQQRLICLWLFMATIITGFFGLILKVYYESFKNPLFVAIMLSVTGFILFFSDLLRTSHLESSQLTMKKSLFIGIGQSIAIIPGISRSGTTIFFSLLTGLDRKNAASFSFLLSIPAILGANLSDFKTLISLESDMLVMYMIAFLAAFISGFCVIKWLIEIVKKAKLKYFAYYCWMISAVSFIFMN